MEIRTEQHNHDEDMEGGPQFGGAPLFSNKPLARLHNLYLVGEIRDPSFYVQWFEVIRTARPQDLIYIHINSPGGNGFTALQLMRAMNECEGKVVASVEGMCMSAATFILLTAHACEISNHSMFMFHNFSGIAVGKGGEMHAQVEASKKWSTTLLNDVYRDFLSSDEIKQILENKDMWMDSDEVIARLKKRSEIHKAELQAQTAPSAEQPPVAIAPLEPVVEVPLKKPRKKRAQAGT